MGIMSIKKALIVGVWGSGAVKYLDKNDNTGYMDFITNHC